MSRDTNTVAWRRVVNASDCTVRNREGALICAVCKTLYDYCDCPGPDQVDMFEYRTTNGVLEARPLRGIDW